MLLLQTTIPSFSFHAATFRRTIRFSLFVNLFSLHTILEKSRILSQKHINGKRADLFDIVLNSFDKGTLFLVIINSLFLSVTLIMSDKLLLTPSILVQMKICRYAALLYVQKTRSLVHSNTLGSDLNSPFASKTFHCYFNFLPFAATR
jgi:hypothetical protein